MGELEVGDQVRPGMAPIPHGSGLELAGKRVGINVNRLTQGSLRDQLAGTPLRRFVPRRVEAAR